jgi:MFS family permease
VPVVGAPSIQREFGVSYLETAGALLLGPFLLSFAIEPPLLLLADRHPRRWFIAGGLFGMAIAAFVAALAPTALVLWAAMGISAVAGGVAAIAQGALVDAHPGQRERMMTRWVMAGTAGDLAAPLLIAGLAALSIGWRGTYALVGGMVAIWGLALARAPVPPPVGAGNAADAGTAVDALDGGERHPGVRATLRGALVNRRLFVWLLASWLCGFLDEILVVFGSLYLRDELAAGVSERSAVLSAFVVGSAAGLAATDRLLARVSPHRLLLAASIGCAICFVLWMAAPWLWLSALLMAAVGATASPLYPIAAAQAYAALPGRSGAVQAAGHLFTPLDVVVPLILGWIADRHGAGAALVVLLAQPVGIAIIAALAPRSGSEKPPGA